MHVRIYENAIGFLVFYFLTAGYLPKYVQEYPDETLGPYVEHRNRKESRVKASNMDRPEIWITATVDKVLKPPIV